MDPWCSGWARGVVDGPLMEWMDPWCSGWARGVVDGPVVKWMCRGGVDGPVE